VINVHYKDYYQRGEIPGDWMKPSPIFFLAVEGIKFKFTVASKNGNLVEKTEKLLKEALSINIYRCKNICWLWIL